jgi:hypothetical protein
MTKTTMPDPAQLHLAPDLALPLEAVTKTFAILAVRGAGKTHTAAVLAEELLEAGLPVVVVDPVGVWWGLRAAADGKGPGLPIVVLGGDHGDLPLAVESGEAVATLVADEQVSLVLDLGGMRKGEQTRFLTAFAETLYHRNRRPLHIIMDEADSYAPQRPQRGEERLLGAIEDLVRRGRARGLGMTLVTQRAAVLNKNVLTQIETLIALRTTSPQDRATIDDWVAAHGTAEQRAAVMSSLSSLPVGCAWVWSPGWLDLFRQVQIRRRSTFDSSATPKVGAAVRAPQTLAPVDLAALEARLATPVATPAGDDGTGLRRQIADLRQQLAARPVERVEVPAVAAADLTRLETLGRELVAQGEALREFGHQVLAAVGRVADARVSAPPPALRPVALARPAPKPAPLPATVPAGAPNLRAGERRILQVLAQRHPTPLTRIQIGTLAGFAPSGGTFSTYIGVLKRAGYIAETAGQVRITPEGFTYLGPDIPAAPQTTAALLALWGESLRAGERRMLETLVAAYPAALPRAELGERTGITVSGGTFGTYLGVLRRNGLATVDGDQVAASPTLFLS